MLIKILPGEYMWSEQGLHLIDENGFAIKADQEIEVEVTNEAQLALIADYQKSVRPQEEQQEIVN